MGDRERSVERQQEEEEEMKMALRSPPVYPLPDEIQKMEHSETVCRYCGISYLIFHEFHQLQTRLAQVEAELRDLRGAAQREKAQREALELGRLEWERALHLKVQRRAEAKEKRMREELEERNGEMERALREEFEQKDERMRREIEAEFEKMSEERERQLSGELGEIAAERVRKQREDMERRTEEREKVLSDALQKANKNLDELRKYLQQLEESFIEGELFLLEDDLYSALTVAQLCCGAHDNKINKHNNNITLCLLAIAASKKEEVERLLGKERERGEALRAVCVQQQQALRATLSLLRSSGHELTDVRGFLSQLAGDWQACRTQILQHSTQVFSELREELTHSSLEFLKMREEKDHLAQQQMEQRRQREEQLSQQQDCDKERRETLLRLRGELEEKEERWLSCQRRCDSLQEQLSAWQRREEQASRNYSAAEKEVTSLKKVLEQARQETTDLKRESEHMIESHGRALTKMEEDCRQQLASKLAAALEDQRTQNALELREQREELGREVELELMIDREKNQLLLLQYQRDGTQLQRKLEEKEQEVRRLQEELQQERRSREEERRRREEERRRREEERHQELQRCQQQEALQLSHIKAELQLMTESNTQLQEEVALLQETVRRECEERGELTAALTQAQEELLGLRAPASHLGSSRPPPHTPERHTPPGNEHPRPRSQARVPLTRSSTPQNTLRPSPPCTDKGGGRGREGGGAGRSLESWTGGGAEKGREGTLPKLRASSSTMRQGKRKVGLVMGRTERL